MHSLEENIPPLPGPTVAEVVPVQVAQMTFQVVTEFNFLWNLLILLSCKMALVPLCCTDLLCSGRELAVSLVVFFSYMIVVSLLL